MHTSALHHGQAHPIERSDRTALDEPLHTAWAATSKYRNQRSYLRSKGIATYRLIRYSDDFVIMAHGTRDQAEALKADTANFLASQGLRLSEAKTQITHVDDGFDFLGFRIQRRPREGKTGIRRPRHTSRTVTGPGVNSAGVLRGWRSSSAR